MLFASKRLVSVEVAPTTSNQHEFNAGLLRKALGFENETSVSGKLELVFLADNRDPVRESADYTLYNARKSKAAIRSAEYRLYYKTKRISELANAGDLIVILRPEDSSNALAALIVQPKSEIEQAVLASLMIGPEALLTRFSAPPLAKAKTAAQHPLIAAATVAGKIPPPAIIAKAAAQIAFQGLPNWNPDSFLAVAVQEESALYFQIEQAVHGEKLKELIATGSASLSGVLSFSLSILQSRKSRRGQSLQLHFQTILEKEAIPHTPQCKTENGETPDFVIPGHAEYRDPSFPESRLRMVACKTTVRERWSQISREAKRIRTKYLLTLDGQLPADVISKIVTADILIFVPSDTKTLFYSDYVKIGTVQDLVNELHAVA